MANVLTAVWFVIGFIVFHTSLLVWTALMLPNPVERARQRVERKPVASFFTGALFAVATIVLATSFLKEGNPGPVQLMGWLLLSPMLVSAMVGGAAFAGILGRRIRSHANGEVTLTALVGGAACTALCGWMPVLGWFAFFPITGLISVGAGALGIISKRQVAVAREPRPEPVAPPQASAPIIYPRSRVEEAAQ
jgi:hypothetical protein